jgi:hypothetical protein
MAGIGPAMTAHGCSQMAAIAFRICAAWKNVDLDLRVEG